MIDGIYTAYLSGQAGQAMAMFVFALEQSQEQTSLA